MKTCPFCEEKDFDYWGLKYHLLEGHCKAFNETEKEPPWHREKNFPKSWKEHPQPREYNFEKSWEEELYGKEGE